LCFKIQQTELNLLKIEFLEVPINNNGEVVGTDIRYGPFYAFLDSVALIYNGSDYTFISPEGWRFSSASAINDSGEVVGWGEDANGVKKGFIYSSGVYFELLPEGWSLTIAFDINDNGEVVGWGVDGAGVCGSS
jgi:probable HAF family extracellular repeat protein